MVDIRLRQRRFSTPVPRAAAAITAAALSRDGIPVLATGVLKRAVPALHGDVLEHTLLKDLHLDTARLLVVAMSDSLATRHLVEAAQRQHPGLPIVARTHSESERKRLCEHGVAAILAEQELALAMSRHALAQLGLTAPAATPADHANARATLVGRAS